MKKFLIILFLFTIHYSLFTVARVNAQTVCQPIYGGGQTCTTTAVTIDKKVQFPPQAIPTPTVTPGAFVDNLGINDPKYAPGQSVNFQITVTNTGNSTIPKIIVRDIVPQFMNFVAGPGIFDASSKTLTLNLLNMGPNQSTVIPMTLQFTNQASLPLDQGTVCVANQSNATNSLTGAVVRDNAQVCVEKIVPVQPQAPGITKGGLKVFPAPGAKGTPPTGPEALVVIPLLSSGLLGHFLRKISWR